MAAGTHVSDVDRPPVQLFLRVVERRRGGVPTGGGGVPNEKRIRTIGGDDSVLGGGASP